MVSGVGHLTGEGRPRQLVPELEDAVVAGRGVSRDENPPTWPPIPRKATSSCRFPPPRALGSRSALTTGLGTDCKEAAVV